MNPSGQPVGNQKRGPKDGIREPSLSKPFGWWTASLLAGWTLCLASLFAWDVHKIRSDTTDLMKVEARALFQKDVIFRRWVSMYGGVYVPVSKTTPPNPYLQVPERDIATPSGRRLTLVNPAYMTRQVHELGKESLGVQGHITSLKPIRPENAPDPWEKKALEAFEKGAEEMSCRCIVNGAPYFRYMAPLRIEPACLKCHGKQGYRVGDIRGGISVSFSMEPFLLVARSRKMRSLAIYGFFWVLGLVGSMAGRASLKKHEEDMADVLRLLDEKNRFTDGILNAIRDGISVLNPDLTVRYVNGIMKEWYRVSMPIVGKRCYKAYHRASKPCRSCPCLRSIQSGRIEREVVPGPPGSPVRWLDLSSYPMKDEATGEITAIVGVVRDVTKDLERNADLQRFKAAVEQTRHFLVMTDPQGLIEYVNPYFERETGYTLDELKGGLILAFRTMPNGEAFFRREVIPAVSEGRSWTRRMEARIKDGSLRTVDVTASPVFDENGRLANIIFVARDVTREIRMERELQQARKMEAIGQLAGGIAHDFNNLLQVINGYADLILSRFGKDKTLAQAVQKIADAGAKAARLVQQLLAFSRRQLLRPEDLDINEVVENSLKMLRRVLGEHIEIHFIPGRDLGTVHADPTMVEQVIMNLAVNARDAMPEGGRLDIETENVVVDEEYCQAHPWAKLGRYVLLSVSDTGHGMDAKTMERIFDPFFTTKELGKGTGLGLATVYGIVKQHDGMIHVYSEPGMGTTFKVYFPISERRAVTVGNKINGAVPGGSETILVVEDDETVRSYAVQVLEGAGYRVLDARDGAEALLRIKERPEIDGLLLDVVMPGMNGWDVFMEVRRLRPGCRVLFMSGYSENAVHTGYVLKKGCRLIQKPFSREMLLREIRKVLDAEGGDSVVA